MEASDVGFAELRVLDPGQATVLELIERSAERRAEHTALLWLGGEEERWSYREARAGCLGCGGWEVWCWAMSSAERLKQQAHLGRREPMML